MKNYIDGFVLSVPTEHITEYKIAAESVAKIWKEYGALSYNEFVGNDLLLEGTLSFTDILRTNNDETVIFGWVEFSSKEARDTANQRVANDPRIPKLIDPLTQSSKIIFDAKRMAYGGFKSLISI